MVNTSIALPGRAEDAGVAITRWRVEREHAGGTKKREHPRSSRAGYRVINPIPNDHREAQSGGQQTVAGSGATLAPFGFYTVNPAASHGYLIETDPRFADYRQWTSSDYMLRQLAVDPALTQMRLGDGFYEQSHR